MCGTNLHRTALVIVAVVLGSAVTATGAIAADGHAGGGGAIAGDRGGGRFVAPRVEHGRYGRGYYPFGYYGGYGGYGGYGSSSNNGCISLDAYGCDE
jgi:hypothetical protein